MERNIVVDVPHDGAEGFDLAEKFLKVNERSLRGGKDFGARHIFLGHEWALHEVTGDPYRDLMDLNREPDDTGDDGFYKKYGMCLDGSPPGVELWKNSEIADNLKEDLSKYKEAYQSSLKAAVNDTRAQLILFGHTMPHLGSGSSTSEVKAGEPNALVSIGNGGDEKGEGDNLLLPSSQAQFLKQKIEQLLDEELGSDKLCQYTGESGKVTSLNDYNGQTSARRTPKTQNREVPSVLIEFNRSLIGHPDDPMFEVLRQRGILFPEIDQQGILKRILDNAMQAYQQKFIQG